MFVTATTFPPLPDETVTLLREKLLPALRDGSYKQAEGHLRVDWVDQATGYITTVGYCCLGVICDLYDPTAWERPDPAKAHPDGRIWPNYIGPEDENEAGSSVHAAFLPHTLAQTLQIAPRGKWRVDWDVWRKVHHDASLVVHEAFNEHGSLVDMNDSLHTFDEIAEVIEYILDHPDVASLHAGAGMVWSE